MIQSKLWGDFLTYMKKILWINEVENWNHSSNNKNDTRSRINWKINLTYFLEETETYFHLYLNTIYNKGKDEISWDSSWCFIVEKEWGCNLNYIKLPRKGKRCKLILWNLIFMMGRLSSDSFTWRYLLGDAGIKRFRISCTILWFSWEVLPFPEIRLLHLI